MTPENGIRIFLSVLRFNSPMTMENGTRTSLLVSRFIEISLAFVTKLPACIGTPCDLEKCRISRMRFEWYDK